ncbi:helix-turn-helix transcriptional regulator [Lacunimicrobium album]
MTSEPNVQLLSVSGVAKLLTISPRTVWRMVSKGEFTKPFHIRKCARWKLSDVLTWLSKNSACFL